MEQTKKCKTCKEELPINKYYKYTQKRAKGSYSHCKACMFKKNATKYSLTKRNEFARNSRKKKKEVIKKLLGKCCQICGNMYHSAAMDAHHLEPSQKEVQLSSISVKNLEKEISKCVLLCSNCHRTIHYEIRKLKFKQLNGESIYVEDLS